MRDPKDLANAIKKLRGERTQKDLAEKAGFDSSTWSVYEKGDRLPRHQDRFVEIARGLGCTLERLDEVIWECRNERVEEEQARATAPAQAPAAAPSLLQDEVDGADPRHSAIKTGLTNLRQGVNEVLQALEDVLLLVADPKSSPF